MKNDINGFGGIYKHELVDNYSRYQRNLILQDIFPSVEGKCACGCGQKLTGRRRRWASDECRELAATHFFIIKGHTDTIRSHLFEIDGGRCRNCGNYCASWQADHIIEVREGGGGCGLENFQTLCEKCHKAKTKSFIKTD